WMTVAANAAENAANWCTAGGTGCGTQGASITVAAVTSGTLVLARGHSDNSPGSACDGQYESVETNCTTAEPAATSHTEKRTHTLKNEEVVWDLGGNVREWTSYFNNSDKPGATAVWYEYDALSGTATMPLSDLVPTTAVKSFWSNSWNSSQNLGKFYPGTNTTGGALRRGGYWDYSTFAGLFGGTLNGAPTNSGTNYGLRCSAVP
ncbi:MAG: hypothetical protein N2F24_09590, partial [Deltaproteobacteria bacterium]